MINPNELRIGNYIQATEGVKQLTGINESRAFYKCQGQAGKYFADTFICEPIPLSPECLQKFGFTKEADPDSGFEEVWQNAIIDRISKRGGRYYFNIEALYGYDVEIKSVHHFQNVYFAFTGTELENQHFIK